MAPRPRALAALAAVAVAVLSLAACGKTDPQADVRATLTQFAHAVAGHDYHTLCTRILAPSVIGNLIQIGLPCEQALARGFGPVQKPTLAVRSIRVHDDRAQAVVHTSAANQPPSDDTIGLVKAHGRWQIASLATVAR